MRLWVAAALVMALAPTAPASLAQSTPQWPSEQEQRLREVDGQILDLQRQRFRAAFAENPDEEAVKQINEQFRELQKERRKLLEATGRL